ncbi:LigT-like protein [Peniophora sp. CONT]|nr:LigT-like protein [Peniophora sp. CONT]
MGMSFLIVIPREQYSSESSSSPGISFWLVPTTYETDTLRKILALRPVPVKSASSFPTFHPHVTLASIPDPNEPDGDMLALRLRESIPVGNPALPLTFQSVEAGDTYTRSVYANITPTSELMHLHAHIHTALGHSANTPKFPHMSLFYIADEDADARVKTLQELGRKGVVIQGAEHATLDARVLDEVDDNAIAHLNGFTASEIWIVRIEGPVEEWKVLDKIVLSTGEKSHHYGFAHFKDAYHEMKDAMHARAE